jgi:LysR family transcriptional regulator for metE and metH
MSKLDLRHLLMLEAMAATPTFAEAAYRLNITPSALTHRLREAERRLALPLVTRGGRRARLTEPGKRMLLAAQRCLAELESAEREARAAAHGVVQQVVRLGASALCGYDWLPALMRHLSVERPEVDVEVVMDVSQNPVAALSDRRIDVAVVPTRVKSRLMTSVRLFQDEMIALVPAAHPKAGRRYLDVDDLAAEVYVTDTVTPEHGREYERLFEPAGLRPARVLRAGHMEAVVALVRAGLGVTVATRTSAATFMSAGGLCMVPLTATGQFLTWHAVIRSTRERGVAPRLVADALAEVVGAPGVTRPSYPVVRRPRRRSNT